MLDGPTTTLLVGLLGLLFAGIGVWVSLRERLVRAETKIEMLESAHRDQKSEVQLLREWLEGQFDTIRKGLEKKADKPNHASRG